MVEQMLSTWKGTMTNPFNSPTCGIYKTPPANGPILYISLTDIRANTQITDLSLLSYTQLFREIACFWPIFIRKTQTGVVQRSTSLNLKIISRRKVLLNWSVFAFTAIRAQKQLFVQLFLSWPFTVYITRLEIKYNKTHVVLSASLSLIEIKIQYDTFSAPTNMFRYIYVCSSSTHHWPI